jgi:ketosteroid isomerase-like protein
MKKSILALILAFALQSCGTGTDSPSQEELVEAWKAELIAADQAFAEAIGEGGLALWADFFTYDGAMIQEGAGEIRGTEAIRAASQASAGAITSFTWTPDRAEVSTGGDLGYTVGHFRTTALSPDSVEMLRTGLYVSIWRRQEDGSWKVEMDLGNPDSAPTIVSSGAPEAGDGGGRP